MEGISFWLLFNVPKIQFFIKNYLNFHIFDRIIPLFINFILKEKSHIRFTRVIFLSIDEKYRNQGRVEINMGRHNIIKYSLTMTEIFLINFQSKNFKRNNFSILLVDLF